MPKQMLINVVDPEESRIAIMENGTLEEIYVESTRAGGHVGDIYKGKVTNVNQSLQAAFVDFGGERNGFLHISDVMPALHWKDLYEKKEKGAPEKSRSRKKIGDVLKVRDEVVVQITKAGIDAKGPALTTCLSLPGRFLVLTPGIGRRGISRKIEDEKMRQRMRKILDTMKVPKNCGLILRTAGMGQQKRALQRDLKYLHRLYTVVQRRIRRTSAPAEIYRENDIVIRTIRDTFSEDINQIIIDSEAFYRKAVDFMKQIMPGYAKRIKRYNEDEPLFHKYNVEGEIEKISSRKVMLPCGGSIVIQQTEALVAIDVNSGSYRKKKDAEAAAYEIDTEAAEEIGRQIRLRDLGGVIIVDFIDMRDSNHIRNVEKTLGNCLKRDRARIDVLKMSRFGIVEITRQRVRPNLARSFYVDCPYCKGRGKVKSTETMALAVLRQIRALTSRSDVNEVRIKLNPGICRYLQNEKRTDLLEIERNFNKKIIIEDQKDFDVEAKSISCYNADGQLVKT
jgi:ribonuclease E